MCVSLWIFGWITPHLRKKIRDDKGYWNKIEAHIQKHTYASFRHGMCPECSDKLYGDEDWYIKMKNEKCV